MQVTLTKDGISNGNRTCSAGDIIDIDSTIATRLVMNGVATYVDAKNTSALALFQQVTAPGMTAGQAVAAIAATLP